jgi:hypothetical protein
MEKSKAYNKIREKGYTVLFLEKQMEIPKNTLQNYVNGSKALPDKHLPIVKKILKKYKINLVV